jgi:heat shock protein HslJ
MEMTTKPSVFSLFSVVVITLAAFGCSAGGNDTGAVEPVQPPPVAAGEPASQHEPEAAETIDLEGAWVLEDLAGRGVVEPVRTTINFEAAGRVFGSGGCNRFTGSYTFEDGVLAFGPLAATKMMCLDGVMEQEDRFHKALAGVVRVEMDGPHLLLYCGESGEKLTFSRVEAEHAE